MHVLSTHLPAMIADTSSTGNCTSTSAAKASFATPLSSSFRLAALSAGSTPSLYVTRRNESAQMAGKHTCSTAQCTVQTVSLVCQLHTLQGRCLQSYRSQVCTGLAGAAVIYSTLVSKIVARPAQHAHAHQLSGNNSPLPTASDTQ